MQEEFRLLLQQKVKRQTGLGRWEYDVSQHYLVLTGGDRGDIIIGLGRTCPGVNLVNKVTRGQTDQLVN